jgi:uracil-DNA glycosylase
MNSYAEAVAALRRDLATGWGSLATFETEALEAAQTVDLEVAAGRTVFPSAEAVFAGLYRTPLESVRAVILGQDPYPTRGNAHGLAFSVPAGRPIPASLKTMFRSIAGDYGCSTPDNGDLTAWADRGVLLLNTILTVREGEPHSHKNIGWRMVSSAIVRAISERRRDVVFLLWGGPAQALRPLIDTAKHGIVACAHPSPLNAQKGGGHPFIDAHPFRSANDYLVRSGQAPINWCL